MRIPELKNEAEARPISHGDQDRPHQKGKNSSYTLIALPLPQAGTASCRVVFPESTVPPPVGKESPGQTSSCPSIVSYFLGARFLAYPMGSAGNWPLDIWLWQRRGEEEQQLAPSSWFHTCRAQALVYHIRTVQSMMEHRDGGPIGYNGAGKFPSPSDVIAIVMS